MILRKANRTRIISLLELLMKYQRKRFLFFIFLEGVQKGEGKYNSHFLGYKKRIDFFWKTIKEKLTNKIIFFLGMNQSIFRWIKYLCFKLWFIPAFNAATCHLGKATPPLKKIVISTCPRITPATTFFICRISTLNVTSRSGFNN